MKTVTIFTDGGCRGNGKADAIGAYGIVMKFTDENNITHTKEFSKAFKGVTNNMMELEGVIQALKLLKEPCEVILITDSKYVCNAINEKWIDGWIKRNWVNSSKQPVKNREQWERLIPYLNTHKVNFFWVKGHANNPDNNRCDELANIAMDKYIE